MTYQILPYTKNKAKLLGVQVNHSKNPKKKLDVYYNGNFICSIGAVGYKDYPTYFKENGKEYAEKRRKLYKLRHEKNRHKIGTPSFFADNLLW